MCHCPKSARECRVPCSWAPCSHDATSTSPASQMQDHTCNVITEIWDSYHCCLWYFEWMAIWFYAPSIFYIFWILILDLLVQWPRISVRRSSSLDWKKDRNRTEPNRKRPDHRLQLHIFMNFFGCQLRCLSKNRKTEKNRSRPVATGLSSRRVLDLTHTHFSLIVGLWIIKNGQKLVEI